MPVRKLILLILAILLAFTAWDIISWYASPESFGNNQSGTVQTLIGASNTNTSELEPFQYIIYWLKSPLQNNTRVVLTYVTEDSASGKINSRIQKGSQKIEFQIPLGRYLDLSCEIKADVGIDKITLSDQIAKGRIQYPFRAAKILIPSAILLALLLLFIYVKPLNNLIKTIDKKIIDPETRYKGVTIVYIIFATAALFHHIYVTIFHKYVLTGATDLGTLLLVFATITFLFGKLWKDKVTWILFALLFLKYAVTAPLGEDALGSTNYIYIMSIYAFFGCYGVGRAISKKYWKSFFSVFCFGWTLAILILASIGIYVASTGNPIKNLGSEWITVDYTGRASFIYQPVTAGIILSTSMFIALLGFFIGKIKILRLFYIFAALVLFFAGSLSGTRTAYLLSALLIAMLLYIPLRDRLKPGIPKKSILSFGKYVLLFSIFLLTAVIVGFIHYQAVKLLQIAQIRGSLMINTAYAESIESIPKIAQRDMQLSSGLDYFFSFRLSIWKDAFEIVTSSPKNFLLGQSVYDPMKPVAELLVSHGQMYFYHCHNTFVQILLENGLPALLLYLSFIFIFIFHAIRLIRRKDIPFGQRILPIGTLICIAEGFVDNTCHVTYGYPQMTILYLFAGFTIALSCHSKKNASAL